MTSCARGNTICPPPRGRPRTSRPAKQTQRSSRFRSFRRREPWAM